MTLEVHPTVKAHATGDAHAMIESLTRALAAQQAQNARIARVGRVGRRIGASLSLERTLRTAVETVAGEFDASSAGLFLVAPDNPERLVLLDRRGFSTDVMVGTYSQRIDEGVIGKAARGRRAIFIRDIRTAGRYIGFAGANRRQGGSEIAVPMYDGERLLGVLNVEAARTLDEEDLHALEQVGAQLSSAIANAHSYATSEAARMAAVADERKRLARELHDSVNQLIFGMSMVAQSLEDAASLSPEQARHRVSRLQDLTDAARGEMRALLQGLQANHEPTSRVSVIAAEHTAEALVQRLRTHVTLVCPESLSVTLDLTGYVPQDPNCEETLLRIAQEALGNVIKHAVATRVRFRLACAGAAVVLDVHDDGHGFDPQSATIRYSGMGLASMRERAQILGATLEVKSAPGAGTHVSLRAARSDSLARSVA